MNRKIIKSILCSLLIVALLAAPVSVLAAGKAAYILKIAASDAPGVYLRSGTDPKNLNKTTDNVIGRLKNGTKVLYWGHSVGQMMLVMTANGKSGFVHKGNLRTYGAMNTKQLYVTKNASAVYRRSGSSMHRVGSVSKGLPVVVYRTNGGWAYIRNLSGKSGYIKTSDLKKLS